MNCFVVFILEKSFGHRAFCIEIWVCFVALALMMMWAHRAHSTQTIYSPFWHDDDADDTERVWKFSSLYVFDIFYFFLGSTPGCLEEYQFQTRSFPRVPTGFCSCWLWELLVDTWQCVMSEMNMKAWRKTKVDQHSHMQTEKIICQKMNSRWKLCDWATLRFETRQTEKTNRKRIHSDAIVDIKFHFRQ